MPPKTRITKDDIVKSATDIVRERGIGEINARDIAARLNCSTQPIFSNFNTMNDLFEAVIRNAYDMYRTCIKHEMEKGEFPPYKASGMAYIEFARQEKELFKLLFMCDRKGFPLDENSEEIVEMNRLVQKNLNLSVDEAALFHLEMWIFVHGIATMLATGYLEFDRELISRMLSDSYLGIKKRYEEK